MKASWLRRKISWLSYKARFGGIEGKCGGGIGGKCGGGIGGKGRGLVLLFACILASVIRNYNFTEGENTVSGVWRNDGKLRERLKSWIDIMKDLDISRLNTKPWDPTIRSHRLLQPCLADSARVGTDLLIVSEIQGDQTATFSQGTVCFDTLGITNITGTWRQGNPGGLVEIFYSNGSKLKGMMRGGALHGLVKKFRCKYDSCNINDEDVSPAYLDSLLVYHQGRISRDSISWWFLVGGGALVCQSNSLGQADGSGCGYLYPDLRVGLAGEWREGRMVSASPATISSLSLESGLMRVEFLIKSPNLVYTEDISTRTNISTQPLLQDPYEMETVYVADSIIHGAGSGVFARRDCKPGDLLSLYNGIRMSERESSLDRDVRRSVYRVFGWGDIVMDIPKDMRRISDYSASLGHKTNHAKLNNAEFSFIKHPRFGEIIGIYATKHIKAGMEIFVDYGYIEKYQATQGIIENILEMMRVTGGWGNKKEFNSDLKRTIGYFRNKVDEMKPLIKAVKMARTFL